MISTYAVSTICSGRPPYTRPAARPAPSVMASAIASTDNSSVITAARNSAGRYVVIEVAVSRSTVRVSLRGTESRSTCC